MVWTLFWHHWSRWTLTYYSFLDWNIWNLYSIFIHKSFLFYYETYFFKFLILFFFFFFLLRWCVLFLCRISSRLRMEKSINLFIFSFLFCSTHSCIHGTNGIFQVFSRIQVNILCFFSPILTFLAFYLI